MSSHYEKLDGIVRCIDDEIPFELPENWGWCRGYSCFEGLGSTKTQAIGLDSLDFVTNGSRRPIQSSRRGRRWSCGVPEKVRDFLGCFGMLLKQVLISLRSNDLLRRTLMLLIELSPLPLEGVDSSGIC